MANQPSIDNVLRSTRIQRELDAKVQKKFRLDPNMTVKDTYVLALQYATRDVVLDAEDHMRIAHDKMQARINARKGL